MIQRLIDFSLDNRLAVVAVWILVSILGLESMRTLPVDAVPDVTNVQVQVLTNSPGLAPQEVERFITVPVETAMAGLPGVEQIRSVSKFGLSAVTVAFDEGTDIYLARQLIAERLTEAREAIPEGYGDPAMGPISSGLGEIYQFEVRGEGYSPMELREILDWHLNYNLRSVKGVVEVNAFGGELKTYQVTVDPASLVAHGLSVGDVLEAIERNNRNAGGGYIEHAGEQYLVRGEGLIGSLEELGDVVVGRDEDGTPVFVRNLATVEFAPVIRQGAVTRDGDREAVVGIVMMLMGANSRTVAADVAQRVEELSRTLPPGVTIDTFYDRTELVDRTIRTVAWNLAEGGALVVIVLLLLLGNLRGGLLVAASIPLSMLVAFSLMRLAGVSGNLMSLGAIDFGIIVDGSVVMIENIVRTLHNRRDDHGATHGEKVRAACREVARPVLFAVGIITLVYVPVLALRGIEGKMFRPMALTVMFALLGSLLCSLTLMPALASLFLKEVSEKEPPLFRWAARLYAPWLSRALARPRFTAAVAFGGFAASLGILPFLGAEFIPRLDEGAIAMQIWRIPSVSLERSNEISLKAEAIVKRFPEVTTVVSRTGRPEIATDPMGVEISDTYLILEPRDTWRFESKEELVEAIDHALKAELPGVMFSYSQPIELRVSELLSGVRSDVGIKLFAPTDDLDRMTEVAERVAAAVRDVPGMAEVKVEQVTGLPTLRVRVERGQAARLGISAEDVLEVVEAIGGRSAGVVMEGQKRFDIQVRFDPSVRADLHRIRDLPVAVPGSDGGAFVPLGQIADVRIETGPAQISRENVSRRISIETNVRGRDLAGTVAEAQQHIRDEVDLPPGWTVSWGGQFENLEAASRRLFILVPVTLLLIFVLLYSAFGAGRPAVLVFLNVPLAITGGLVALALRGYPFSISAGVGFIALFGIAVMNGVVLMACLRDTRQPGEDPAVAAERAAKMRLRAVLMTAVTDVLGFIPMAIAVSAGAEVQRPLATVVVGGIVTSTLLTLLVLPAVYSWSERRFPTATA